MKRRAPLPAQAAGAYKRFARIFGVGGVRTRLIFRFFSPLKPRGLAAYASSRSSRGGSHFLKDEKMGKRIFLRGGFPYARENKIITSRLTLKRNANVASLPLLFLMRKARTHKAKGSYLARIYPSFGARPHSVSCPRGEVSDAIHCVLHKPPFAFTPSQAQSAKRCASERGFLLFLLSRTEGKLPSIKDFLSAFLVSLQERQASTA